jgi:hypothetical protein
MRHNPDMPKLDGFRGDLTSAVCYSISAGRRISFRSTSKLLSQARREDVLAVLAPFACGGAAEELTTITEGCDHDDPGRDGAERGRDY